MPEPIDIPTDDDGCCDDFNVDRCTNIGARIQEVICKLRGTLPSVFVRVDIYRSYIASEDPSRPSDDQDVQLAKIADNITCVLFQRQDRWFQEGYGVVRIKVDELWIPSIYRVRPDDHVVLPNNEQAMVVDVPNSAAGINVTKIDYSKTRLALPKPRTQHTYRVVYAGARIV